MAKKLVIIHTSPVTVEPLKALAREILPDCTVSNIVDDSILPELAENGADLDAVAPRWTQYARIAERLGADCILNACSSIGEIGERAGVAPPIVRIDEAMAEEAVCRGLRIGVAATLRTTLGPTMRLIERKADASGVPVEITPMVADDAFRRLSEGDREAHDALLREALSDLAGKVDVVVLAQASMARVVESLPEEMRGRFLSSPRLGMERVRHVLESAPCF